MKLFTKTLFFFIGVIVFQSSLTFLLITNFTKRSNLEDAGKELTQEATIVLENYNSWKRGIWKTLNDIRQDQQLSTLLRDYQETLSPTTLIGVLKEKVYVSGADTFVVKYATHNERDIIPITYNNFSLSDVQGLENRKPHPYLELQLITTQLCLIGITRLSLGEEVNGNPLAYIDLFILKRIDKDFCHQLVLNRDSQAAFFLDDHYLSGTLAEQTFLDIPGFKNFDTSHHKYNTIEIKNIGYNVATRKIENVLQNHIERTLSLVTVLPNTSYVKRLSLLENTVLSVTALCGLLAILLSLFFSRNITRPIYNLLAAMQRIRNGQYKTTLATPSHNEIGKLIQGFNDMADKIHQDKEQLENYIHEITILKDYNENIIQSIRIGMIIINQHLTAEKVNSAFLEAFDLQEEQVIGISLGKLHLSIIDDEILQNVRAILERKQDAYTKVTRAKRNHVYELKLYPIDSDDQTGSQSDNTLGCLLVIEDISRKIEFEEKIFQAEKLSSISMLSAGVAHEINNPLGSIMTNVQNLIEEEKDEERSISLKWIEQETRRIARIVQELLEFSSSSLDRTQETDVNRVIEETITLITYSLKSSQDIFIRTELEEDIPLVLMSQDEFKQIIINLIKNAIQAIEGKGEIFLITQNIFKKNSVWVTVKDNGIGIRDEDIPRIFDPFYTTKHNGEGTGLGLSVVYGIINKYKGTITVESQEGEGTQIRLAIPVLETF